MEAMDKIVEDVEDEDFALQHIICCNSWSVIQICLECIAEGVDSLKTQKILNKLNIGP